MRASSENASRIMMKEGRPENMGAHRIRLDPRLAGFTRRLAASEPLPLGVRELARFRSASLLRSCSLGSSRQEASSLGKAGASSALQRDLDDETPVRSHHRRRPNGQPGSGVGSRPAVWRL